MDLAYLAAKGVPITAKILAFTAAVAVMMALLLTEEDSKGVSKVFTRLWRYFTRQNEIDALSTRLLEFKQLAEERLKDLQEYHKEAARQRARADDMERQLNAKTAQCQILADRAASYEQVRGWLNSLRSYLVENYPTQVAQAEHLNTPVTDIAIRMLANGGKP